MILVGGIGNIFFGDDGFGCEVARRLQRRALPEHVRVVDFGIRGIDLGFALEDSDAAILIDVVERGASPGTLYVIEPAGGGDGGEIDPHSATPDRVLRWISGGRRPKTLRLVGCEPATFVADALGCDGLSPPVLAAVDSAVELVEDLIAELGRA